MSTFATYRLLSQELVGGGVYFKFCFQFIVGFNDSLLHANLSITCVAIQIFVCGYRVTWVSI
jgi:hypothetical protein